jgi:hypothetical protein
MTANLDRIFRTLYQRARALYPELPSSPLATEIGDHARTSDRSFAWFRYPGGEPTVRNRAPHRCKVAMSPDLERNPDRATAVIAHELGHAVDHLVGRPELTRRLAHVARPDGTGTVAEAGLPGSSERLADLVAESILGGPLYYDAETVQTIDRAAGVYRPRPDWLG